MFRRSIILLILAKPWILSTDDDAGVLRAAQRDLRQRYAGNYRILGADPPGGEVELESQPGDTRCLVRLPLVAPNDAPANEAA